MRMKKKKDSVDNFKGIRALMLQFFKSVPLLKGLYELWWYYFEGSLKFEKVTARATCFWHVDLVDFSHNIQNDKSERAETFTWY